MLLKILSIWEVFSFHNNNTLVKKMLKFLLESFMNDGHPNDY